MEISLLLALDRSEQAALQAALFTHGAPDSLVTMALTGACKITSLAEARALRHWLAKAAAERETDVVALAAIARELNKFGV